MAKRPPIKMYDKVTVTGTVTSIGEYGDLRITLSTGRDIYVHERDVKKEEV